MRQLVVVPLGGTVGDVTGQDKEGNDDRTAPGDRFEFQPRRRFGGQDPGEVERLRGWGVLRLLDEAAAHEAVMALTAAGLIVAAADQAAADAVADDIATMQAAEDVAAESVAESLITIAAADEIAAEATSEAGERVRAASITMAEAQVLRYLPTPLPFSVIAGKLGISRSAAKERAARLYHRLGVHSRDEAVSRARSLGLIRGK